MAGKAFMIRNLRISLTPSPSSFSTIQCLCLLPPLGVSQMRKPLSPTYPSICLWILQGWSWNHLLQDQMGSWWDTDLWVTSEIYCLWYSVEAVWTLFLTSPIWNVKTTVLQNEFLVVRITSITIHLSDIQQFEGSLAFLRWVFSPRLPSVCVRVTVFRTCLFLPWGP